jgi:1,4-dihydroxy-2-naphthoate octaprenyltransferase
MRDHKNDRDSGKHTLVVAIGYRSAKVYHGILTCVPVILLGLYILSTENNYNWTFFAAPLFIVTAALIRISRVTEAQRLDRELKFLALTTFFTSALFILAVAIQW